MFVAEWVGLYLHGFYSGFLQMPWVPGWERDPNMGQEIRSEGHEMIFSNQIKLKSDYKWNNFEDFRSTKE